ncbi:MAG: thioredoxin [Lachnospiraceae bacterium]|nr:thioredoxin [Lachnospiraceae bacterium]
MQPIVITADNFEEKVINSPKKILVDFWASWCGPCKALSPIVEEIAENADDSYLVGKVNIDDNRNIALKYKVMSIPTVILFENGEEKKRSVGLVAKDDLLELLK